MSTNKFITNLLNLKDENIIFSNNISQITKKGVLYNLIDAKLTYTPDSCPICGTINEKYSIIKNGTRKSDIRILPINGYPTILRLYKQRFLCKHCQHTFSASTNIVKKHCFIAQSVKLKVLADLTLKISEKDISKLNYVSHSTVSKAIDKNFKHFSPNLDYLPEHLLFDEFKSTSSASGAMSFLFVDSTSHQIVDILEDRKLHKLKKYFSHFTKQARHNVKTICIDMYSPYISLIKDLFPKAEIIIDRFHIVQLLTKALNQTRIDAMKKLSVYSFDYKRLKRYWKLFLKNKFDLNMVKFKPFVHFKDWISERTLVEKSIAVNSTLKNTYDVFQTLLYDIQSKNYKQLKEHLENFQNEEISNHLKTAISTLLKYYDYICNALIYEFSNGIIEGINNFIKVIKRIAFGYKSFFHFRNRILITRKLIQPIKNTEKN